MLWLAARSRRHPGLSRPNCADTVVGLEAYPEFHGSWVASWLPPEGSVCWEKSLLNAAANAVYDPGVKVALC